MQNKKFTNTNNKKYIFFLFVANASCTIETNKTLNLVYKCFTINQIYMEIFTFFQILDCLICSLFINLTLRLDCSFFVRHSAIFKIDTLKLVCEVIW